MEKYLKSNVCPLPWTSLEVDVNGGASPCCLYKGSVPNFLKRQQEFYREFYSWDKRKSEWTNFLQGLLHEQRSKL